MNDQTHGPDMVPKSATAPIGSAGRGDGDILDPPSEGLLVWEQPGFPQTDYAAFALSGEVDTDALSESLSRTLATRPTFSSHLFPARVGWLRVPVWHRSDRTNTLRVTDLRGEEVPDGDLETWVHRRLAPYAARIQDLRVEFPLRVELILLPGSRALLVFVFHHVATDGGGLYDFIRDLLANYHERVTGRTAIWSQTAGIHAQADFRPPPSPISPGRMVLRLLRQDRDYPTSQCAQIAGTPSADSGRMMVRRVFEGDAFAGALRARARRDGGTITDLCLAASKLALAEWNGARGDVRDVFLHGMAVNQRGRKPASQIQGQGNPMSAVTVCTRRSDRGHPDDLLRLVIARRIAAMDQGQDVALSAVATALTRGGRAIPYPIRYRTMRLIFDRPISFFLTNLGIVWPVVRNGRPTGETAIRGAGQFQIVDVHSSVGATRNNPLGMILRTFLGRFYVVFTFGGHRITRAEAEAFTDLVIARMEGYL